MDSSKHLELTPTDLIDWLHGEGLLELDWDFPENGDLIEAGLDSVAMTQLVPAVEDEYGVELLPEDLVPEKIGTPLKLARLISSKSGAS